MTDLKCFMGVMKMTDKYLEYIYCLDVECIPQGFYCGVGKFDSSTHKMVAYKTWDLTSKKECDDLYYSVLQKKDLVINYNGLYYDLPIMAIAHTYHSYEWELTIDIAREISNCFINPFQFKDEDDTVITSTKQRDILKKFHVDTRRYYGFLKNLKNNHCDLTMVRSDLLTSGIVKASLKSAGLNVGHAFKERLEGDHIEYNKNDIKTTYELFKTICGTKRIKELWDLQKLEEDECITKYAGQNVPCASYISDSNTKITRVKLQRQFKDVLESWSNDRKPDSCEELIQYDFKYIDPIILQNYIEYFNEFQIPKIKGEPVKKVEFSVMFNDMEMVLGQGGIHGVIDGEYENMTYLDFKSYYPALIFELNLLPYEVAKHMYDLMELRLGTDTKKGIPKSNPINYDIKIQLNSLSGKLKDKYDKLLQNYVSYLTMTVNGQLIIVDLICYLKKKYNINCVHANTDGIGVLLEGREIDIDEVFKGYLDTLIPKVKSAFKSNIKGNYNGRFLILEREEVKKAYYKNVNNFIWLYENGSITSKSSLKIGYNHKTIPLIYGKFYEWYLKTYSNKLSDLNKCSKPFYDFISQMKNPTDYLFYSKPNKNCCFTDNESYKFTYFSKNPDKMKIGLTEHSIETNRQNVANGLKEMPVVSIANISVLSSYNGDDEEFRQNLDIRRYYIGMCDNLGLDTQEIESEIHNDIHDVGVSDYLVGNNIRVYYTDPTEEDLRRLRSMPVLKTHEEYFRLCKDIHLVLPEKAIAHSRNGVLYIVKYTDKSKDALIQFKKEMGIDCVKGSYIYAFGDLRNTNETIEVMGAKKFMKLIEKENK